MLAANRNGRRCVYCAFRVHYLNLELRRTRSSLRSSRRSPAKRFTFSKEKISGSPFEHPDAVKARVRTDGPNGRSSGGEFIRPVTSNWADALAARRSEMKKELSVAPVLEFLRREEEAEGRTHPGFDQIWKEFEIQLRPIVKKPFSNIDEVPNQRSEILKDLRDVYKLRGQHGLDERIKYHFYAHVTGSRFSQTDIKNQKALADLRYPAEWFPATRQMHRTIHLHVGPTNSGKTYQALKRLEKASKGIYAGPLRLLAHEVFSRLNAKGRSCALITGEERRLPPSRSIEDKALGNFLAACTVEMVPTNVALDVAIIDEIQMIGNAERGWAWTQALLGVQAKEVHLCGEERAVPLIQQICASVGEKLEVHRYERLSPLRMAASSLEGDLRKLKKGDCIVSFSVMGIHALRYEIERATGKKVATVYGGLPPETRAQQARLFNDPDNDYDFLVASDAIGMGLNLAIKRVIFERSSKYNGFTQAPLSIADIKQIGGRAGRYKVALDRAPDNGEALAAAKGDFNPHASITARTSASRSSLGLITTLEKFDFPFVARAMAADPEPIESAGIFPPSSALERFASYFPPGTPFSYIMARLHELSQMNQRFHLCGLKDYLWIADLIEPITALTIADRSTMCAAPAGKGDMEMWTSLIPAYARCIAGETSGALYDIEALPLEVLEQELGAKRDSLVRLERLHKGVVTYLWLSYRFPGIFTTRALAFHVKALTERKIEQMLEIFSFSSAQRRQAAAKREAKLQQQMEYQFMEVPSPAVLEDVFDKATDRVRYAQAAEEDEVEERFVQEDEDQHDVYTGRRFQSAEADDEHFSGETELILAEPEQLDMVENADETGEEPDGSILAEWRMARVRQNQSCLEKDPNTRPATPKRHRQHETSKTFTESPVSRQPDTGKHPPMETSSNSESYGRNSHAVNSGRRMEGRP